MLKCYGVKFWMNEKKYGFFKDVKKVWLNFDFDYLFLLEGVSEMDNGVSYLIFILV